MPGMTYIYCKRKGILHVFPLKVEEFETCYYASQNKIKNVPK